MQYEIWKRSLFIFATILVTMIQGIAMIRTTKGTMEKQLTINNTDNDNNSP